MAVYSSAETDVDAGIPDLIRRLTDDSKRLAVDEVRLAKMELRESVRKGIHGSVWLAVALGVGVVAIMAFTVLAIALIAQIAGDNVWAGALIVGVLELGAGWFLLRKGLKDFSEPSYTLAASRESLKDTAVWARRPAAR